MKDYFGALLFAIAACILFACAAQPQHDCPRLIQSTQDYEDARHRIKQLSALAPAFNSPEFEELKLRVLLVDIYESELWPVPVEPDEPAEPITAPEPTNEPPPPPE